MAALAELSDLKAVMRRGLTEDDIRRSDRLFDIASERVRTFTGVHFTQATTTKRVRVRNGRARLPQGPVSAVSAVVDVDDNPVSFEWYGGQVVDCNPTLINAFELNLRRRAVQWVDVTYTHGYATIPADVVGVVCDMVAAALDSPPEEVGEQSETLGPFTRTVGSQFPGGIRLTQSMKDSLLPYMATAGTATVA